MKQNRWDDHYTRRAKNENWLARSVYKLQEIDSKFNVIRQGNRVLDLGCYPGSWSQYALRKVGPHGEVVGMDLNLPDHLSARNFRFIQADVMVLEPRWLAREMTPRHVVLSDLAPPTTGIKATDTGRSMSLAIKGAEVARALLRKRGHFVCKIFEGEGLKSFRSELSGYFGQVRLFRPKATRKRSREVYLVAQGWIAD